MTEKQLETSAALKSLIVLARAQHAVEEEVRKDIQSHGLTPTEFGVLELLFHKGKQPIQHIGKRILLTSGSMTYVIDKLEKKDLLQRVRCPKDRRIVYAEITDKGYQQIEQIFPAHEEKITEIFSVLNPEEKKQFITLLKRVGLSLPK